MAAVSPPYVVQALSHPADVFRRVIRASAGAGILRSGDLVVTANGTPNMTVNVAAGEAVLPGTENALSQGSYLVQNDATVNLAIAAADPTNPRNDLVVAKVQDAAYSGATNAWTLAVVTGTPAASPLDPAAPANSLILARVRVNPAATSIVAGNITDLRAASSVGVGTTSPLPAGSVGPRTGIHIQDDSSLRAPTFVIEDIRSGNARSYAVEVGFSALGALTIRDLTAGQARVTILAGGQVGIGTVGPTTQLHVANSVGTPYSAAGSNLVANHVLEVQNVAADAAGLWAGIAFNIPTGANRIGGIGLVSRGVGNQKADLFFFGDDGGSRAEKFRITAEGHLVSSGSAPALGALQTGVASQSISGTDTRGEITFTTAASPPAANALIASVTWANPYTTRPFVAPGQGDTLPGGAVMGWITTPSTTGMGLYSAAAPIGSANYGVQYLVIG